MISSVDGFYIMDTESVCDNYSSLLCMVFVQKTLCRMKMPVQDSVWHLQQCWLWFHMRVLWLMRLMHNNCICKCSGNCRMSAQFTLPISVWKPDSQITANEQQWVHLWEWIKGSERNLHHPASNIIWMPRLRCWVPCAHRRTSHPKLVSKSCNRFVRWVAQ